MTDKDSIAKNTIAKMYAGAKIEQKKFDEIQKARKELKNHLEVI